VNHRKYQKPPMAAEKIGVTLGCLANWRWKGIGPPYYVINNMIRYADDEVDAWIAAGRQSTSDEIGPSAPQLTAAPAAPRPRAAAK
jgi:hypothetical protein